MDGSVFSSQIYIGSIAFPLLQLAVVICTKCEQSYIYHQRQQGKEIECPRRFLIPHRESMHLAYDQKHAIEGNRRTFGMEW
ncbi:hypothetical protein BDR05DRAFT_620359 [Suillus weaverae]|nr:hypothetical protein BDR05DRAFT_620359 [Suillus weaverae]